MIWYKFYLQLVREGLWGVFWETKQLKWSDKVHSGESMSFTPLRFHQPVSHLFGSFTLWFHWLIIQPVSEELGTGVTNNFCLSFLSLFSPRGSWILQTRHWTEVNCSDLREHNNLHLTKWDLWEFPLGGLLKSLGRGTGVRQTIRWSQICLRHDCKHIKTI